MEDLGLNVKVEVIEVMVMEEYCKQCNYEDIIPIRKTNDVESRFYQNFIEINFFKTKFPLLKSFLLKLIYTNDLDCIYL